MEIAEAVDNEALRVRPMAKAWRVFIARPVLRVDKRTLNGYEDVKEIEATSEQDGWAKVPAWNPAGEGL
jgi:hypothetical protein